MSASQSRSATGPTLLHEIPDFLAGGGTMGRLIREKDWSATPLGPLESWPQSLRTTVSLCLASNFPISIIWGPQRAQIYNDAYIQICAGKHPHSLGQDFWECWASTRSSIGDAFDSAAAGKAAFLANRRMFLDRNGYLEETFFTFSFSPIRDESGHVAGLFHPVTEVTDQVLAERRLHLLRDVADRTADAKSVAEACTLAGEALAARPLDVPFALLYLLDSSGERATLASASGLTPGSPPAPQTIDLTAAHDYGWPLKEALRTDQGLQLDKADSFFNLPACDAYPEPPRAAFLMPINIPGVAAPFAILIAGVSPRRPLDATYRAFYVLLRDAVANELANARAYDEERKRVAALAELDRVKVAFFSNVSHEFRTPLTLMLGPVDEAIANVATPPTVREQLALARRNSLRLLKLVNSLLDFSRIEAGRMQASYESCDLAALTRDLASTFRSTIERAGLRFIVECEDLNAPVYVDREMWEKIVLNLLSNAFKFTLEGSIGLRLRCEDTNAVLEVLDTGVGIPADELPRIFTRFHRIESTRGRTHEGSGIGLALVQELVKLHGGTIVARSRLGDGSAFTLKLPLGADHLPPDRIKAPRTQTSTVVGAQAFVHEAAMWLRSGQHEGAPELRTFGDAAAHPDQRFIDTFGARIVLADDNADMRTYVRDLLSSSYKVEAVADGEEALEAIRRDRPDLLLADIMMPRLDGFGLLKALRGGPALRNLPVIFLSARAGEESRIEGLDAGADDYLVKPFSGRELLARVGALLERARIHRQALANEQELTRAARDAGARLNLALSSITDQFFVLDQDWCYTLVNPRVLQVTGKSEAELLGRHILEVFPEARDTEFERQLRHAYLHRKPLRFEFCNETYARWFENAVYPFSEGVAVLVTDMTERKRLQTLAATRTAQFATLLAEAPLGTYLVDADFRIAEVNPAARAAFDNLPDLIGRDFGEVMHLLCTPAHADEVSRIFRHTLRTGQPYSVAEQAVDMTNHPETRYCEWQISRIPLSDGRFGVVCYFRDISAQIRTRDALQEAARQKDQFLAMLAHELRNPLVPLTSAAEILAQTTPADSQTRSVGAMINRQVTQLTRLVDDLLDVSRIVRGRITLQRSTVELAAVINHAVEAVEPLIRQREQKLSIVPNSHPLRVDADFARLVQCVENLLTNASKYTDPGGTILLQTRAEDDSAVLEVTDTGIGIAPDLLPHIFDPFVQSDRSLDRSQGGLGIGLSVVKGLVEMHGGQVEARSGGSGCGSTFTLRLPLIAPALDRSTRPESLEISPQRILVVDDNKDVADSLAAILALKGHRAEVAYTPADALERIAAFTPDVALLDLGLPEMNGYELAERLRQMPQCTSMRIIALTGYGSTEDRRRTRAAGFDEHLTKPVEFSTLQRALTRT